MSARFGILSMLSTAAVMFGQSAAQPITVEGRADWAIRNTLGWPSLLGGSISAGWGTAFNHPPEYGPHWDGFAKRYGMRLTGIAAGNAIDAGLGALWGADPRYFRHGDDQPFGDRLWHVIAWTVLAKTTDGRIVPAYSRFVAISGSNFLSNAWRADSEADTGHAVERIGLGFLGRLTKNAFDEFWPDVKQRVFGRER